MFSTRGDVVDRIRPGQQEWWEEGRPISSKGQAGLITEN